MKKHLILALPLAFALSQPAKADPALGLGVTFTWGGASATGGTGLGVRLFSDDTKGDVVGSLGADYMIADQRIRPSVGIAYLASKSYVGMDVGYDFAAGNIDVGVGLGAASTKRPSKSRRLDLGGDQLD